MKVINLSENYSLVTEFVNELRHASIQKDRMRFRRNLERIGEVGALEISKKLKFKNCTIETPLGVNKSNTLEIQPVVVTILRAGVPLFNGVMNYFDKADSGFVAAYRKHETNDYFSIQQDYITCPDLTARPLILTDPMLATGASLVEALKDLMQNGTPSEIHILCAIAAEQGIEKIKSEYPDATLWCGAVDKELTNKGYIMPGLGDAGDLSFGTKMQG